MRKAAACAVLISVATALAGCGKSSRQAEVEAAVSYRLKDPGSVQFRDVRSCSADQSAWRGQYNAKNGFGAYVGFKDFIYANNTVETVDDYGFMGHLERCYGKLAG